MATERIQRQIDRLLDDAEVAVNASDWAAVAEKARAVLAIEEANPDAQAFLKMAEANGVSRGPASQAEHESSPPPVSSALVPTLPSSFAGGRYAVRRFLGEGGRKRVYLAHDSRLDREVAFCMIRAEGLDLTGHQRVVREAQSVARLGQHPNLVTVHDIGEDGGNPYIVQEYMAGRDVAGLIERSADHRLSVEQMLQIFQGRLPGAELPPCRGHGAPRPQAGKRLALARWQGGDRRLRSRRRLRTVSLPSDYVRLSAE